MHACTVSILPAGTQHGVDVNHHWICNRKIHKWQSEQQGYVGRGVHSEVCLLLGVSNRKVLLRL